MLIDTHAHLDFPDYNNDREEVIKRANASGVGLIINAASSAEASFASVKLSKEYECIYACCGIHPHDAGNATDREIARLKDLALSSEKVVAIGEIGLDFFRDLSPRKLQYEALVKFIRLSRELDLPLILHCREEAPDKKDASAMLFKALEENLDKPFKGVMHCFSGDEKLLEKCLDAGLHVSFTCNITYKNADRAREVLKAAPLNRLLLETDSPFLAPQAKRGKRNEPQYLTYLTEAIAENLNIAKEEVERVTTENCKRLFF